VTDEIERRELRRPGSTRKQVKRGRPTIHKRPHQRLAVPFDDETIRWLEFWAEAENVSLAQVVRDAVSRSRDAIGWPPPPVPKERIRRDRRRSRRLWGE
jgi:hypothetical protein